MWCGPVVGSALAVRTAGRSGWSGLAAPRRFRVVRQGRRAGRFLRPDQENLAWCVIKDEAAGGSRRGVARSPRKNHRNTAYSITTGATHGAAIRPANEVKLSPLAENASKLVKFDTGSSSDAEFARCVQAYTCGRGRAATAAAVANTTGVSSTTAAPFTAAPFTAAPSREHAR